MISVLSAGSDGLESISDQMSWRWPVSALITTTGWSGSNDSSISVIGTAPVLSNACWLSSPGTLVMIMFPGLNPSLRLNGSGRIGTSCRLRGIDRTSRFTRRPVGVEGSGTVK